MQESALMPMKGFSTDGRFRVVQNGVKGFLGKKARRKWRGYVEDMRVLNDNNGVGYARQARMNKGVMDMDYPGGGGVHSLLNPDGASQEWVDDILGGREDHQLRKLLEDTDRDKRMERLLGMNDRRRAMDDLLGGAQGADGDGGHWARGRGDGVGGGAGSGRRRGGGSGPPGYTNGGRDGRNDGGVGTRRTVLEDEMLEEEDDGMTTFRVEAVGNQEPIEFEMGEVIEIQPLPGYGPRRLLQVKDVVFGRESLVNDAVGMQRSRAGQGAEQRDGAGRCKRSTALYMAYVRAKVTISEIVTGDDTLTESRALNDEQGL